MAFDDGVKTVSGSVAHTDDAATKVPFVSVKCGIEPTLTGVSEVSATQTGENLFNEDWEIGGINDTTGVPNSDTNKIRSKTFSQIKGGTTCYVGAPQNIRVLFYTSGETFISETANKKNASFSVPSNCALFKIRGTVDYGTTYNNDIIICYGSTAHAYEPYTTPTTYTANLGRTVYGGQADIVNGTGVDGYGIITFDGSNDENWQDYSSYNGFYIAISQMKVGTRQDGVSNYLTNSQTSAHTQDTYWLGVNSNRLFLIEVYNTMGNSITALRSYLSEHPLTVVFPLATPTDFTFTPITPIPETVGKVNNVYCNTGDTEVTYHDNAHGFSEVTVNKTGKNLIDGTKFTRGLPSTTIGASIDTITTSNRYAYYGIRAGGGSLTVSSTSSDTDYFTLVLIWGYKDGVLTYYSNTQPGTSKTVDFSNCDYVRIGIGAKSGTTVPTDLTGYGTIQLELGSQATSYEPYEAVSKTAYLHKVIYGGQVDVIKGTCKPKNLLKLSDGTCSIGNTGASATISNGSIVVTGTTTSSGGRTTMLSDYFTLKAGTYIISPVISTSPYVRSYLNKKSDNSVVGYSSGSSFTVNEDVEVYFGINVESGYTYDATITPQLEAGSSVSDYAPYFEPFSFPPISIDTVQGENTLFANEGDSAITYRRAVD